MTTGAESSDLRLDTESRVSFGIASVAVAVCLGFAAYTEHIWEDYFITFRASLNLATGNGLVFQPGERVHTFTSPLGTLLPALFALGGGEHVAIRALWGLRIISALAVGAAAWTAMRAFLSSGIASVVSTGIGLALILDAKIVDFSINGMETGLVVLFVVLSWYTLSSGARLWPSAVCFAGLQWTRPDGFVFFGTIALGWLIFGDKHNVAWRNRMMALIRAISLGIALYLPWLLFAWIYYGSPVPHTIVAKSLPRPFSEITDLLVNYPWRLIFGAEKLHDVFKPAYFFLGGWPLAFKWFSRVLAVGAAITWIWPRVAPAGRMASAAFFLGGFYVAYIPIFPWYYPGWQALGWLAWAFALHAVWTLHPQRSAVATLARSATRIVTTIFASLQLVVLCSVAWQMHVQQIEVENSHRAEIGRWLARHAKAKDTVFVECLGYIGYYSKLKMFDYPGLSSPEVVAARKAGHQTYARVIGTLKPDWVVLRPWEEAEVFREVPSLRQTYVLERKFDVREKIDAYRILPGRGYLDIDSVFLVFRRSLPSDPQP